MKPHPTILYLNASPPGDRIAEMTLAGIRRYADAVGWCAEAFSRGESGVKAIPALLAAHAPVAGCVFDCSEGRIPATSKAFGGVPVVYLHAAPHHGGDGIVRLQTDNTAVAVAAFRELSLERPAAYAVAGYRLAEYWTLERERVFAGKCAEAEAQCHAFERRVGERASARAKRLAVWVAGLPHRTAIFAASDAVAAEVAAAARTAFRNIPRELTLLGVDNRADICETGKPAISSIQIDFERAGHVAARMIGEFVATENTKKHKDIVNSVPFVAEKDGISIGPLLAVRRESTGGWGRRESFVLEAVERIRREACDGLTAERLARDFPGSRWLFEMRFREATGHSVLEEIQHVRLEKVCAILSQTDTAIGAIADMCGYRSGIALKWIFRKRMGMSLTEWRVRNRR